MKLEQATGNRAQYKKATFWHRRERMENHRMDEGPPSASADQHVDHSMMDHSMMDHSNMNHHAMIPDRDEVTSQAMDHNMMVWNLFFPFSRKNACVSISNIFS